MVIYQRIVIIFYYMRQHVLTLFVFLLTVTFYTLFHNKDILLL